MTLINPCQLDPDSSIITVSGANRSIGAAVAVRLHAEGNRLSLAARDPSGIQKNIPGNGGILQKTPLRS